MGLILLPNERPARYRLIHNFDLRLKFSDAHHKKVTENLTAAELLFENGHFDQTIDTLCNALFHLMQSLLTLTGRQAHEFTDAMLLIKTIFIEQREEDTQLQSFLRDNPPLPSTVYSELNWIRKQRNAARYSPTTTSTEENAKETITKVVYINDVLFPYIHRLYTYYQEQMQTPTLALDR